MVVSSTSLVDSSLRKVYLASLEGPASVVLLPAGLDDSVISVRESSSSLSLPELLSGSMTGLGSFTTHCFPVVSITLYTP
jgi:hypothetical protein